MLYFSVKLSSQTIEQINSIYLDMIWFIKNRQSNRGGVAIYINSKLNYKLRDDLMINQPGILESIFDEIQSPRLNAIVGEIYRIPNTYEVNSINMYETIVKRLQTFKHHMVLGTDQNFDFIKINQRKIPLTSSILFSAMD